MAARKVPVLVLPEEHANHECRLKNTYIIMEEIRRLGIDNMLYVSEGTEINNCYTALVSESRITAKSIIEHPPGEESDIHRFSKFLLIIDAMAPGLTDGDGVPLDETWHIKAMTHKHGYAQLMLKIDSGIASVKALIKAGLRNDLDNFSRLKGKILTAISESSKVDEEVKGMAAELLVKKNFEEIDIRIREFRDRALMKKITERVISNKAIQKVIIVIGVFHYYHLKYLISQSPYLSFDEKSESALAGLSPSVNISSTMNAEREKFAAMPPPPAVAPAVAAGGAGAGGGAAAAVAPAVAAGGAGGAAAAAAAAPAPMEISSSIKPGVLKDFAISKGINVSTFTEKREYLEALEKIGYKITSGGYRKRTTRRKKNRQTRKQNRKTARSV